MCNCFSKNLGLGNLPTFGSAASKDVGTGAGQIPDMSAFASGNNYFKLPSGWIVQLGFGQSVNGAFISTFPVPFTTAGYFLFAAVNSQLGTPAIPVVNTAETTRANINVVNPSGQGVNVSLSYVAIGKL